MYIYLYICIYIYIYICVCVCLYIYIYTYTQDSREQRQPAKFQQADSLIRICLHAPRKLIAENLNVLFYNYIL